MYRLIALIALVQLLSACAVGAVQLDQRHVDLVVVPTDTARQGCRMGEVQFRDTRPHPQLGTIRGHALTYDELLSWVERSLRASVSTDPARPALQIELARAYIESHPSGNSFQLVLRAAEAGAADPQWRVYRGLDSGITWWGNSGEYGRYVEVAGKRALANLIAAEADCEV